MLLIGGWRDVAAPEPREKVIGDRDDDAHKDDVDDDDDGDYDNHNDDDDDNVILPLSRIYQGVVSHIVASQNPP